MTKGRFLIAAAVISTLALVTSLGIGNAFGVELKPHKGIVTQRAYAAWAYKTADPATMARDVDAIVVATWIGVSPGRVAYSSSGEDAMAFELNDFTVEEVIQGRQSPPCADS